MVYEKKKKLQKSTNTILVLIQRYQDSRNLLQNQKVPKNVMGFSNNAQRFNGPNYLDEDIKKRQNSKSQIEKTQIVIKLQTLNSEKTQQLKL